VVRIVWIFSFMSGVYLSGFVSFMTGVICLLRGLVLGCCVFLFVVLLNLNFHLLLLGSFKKNKKNKRFVSFYKKYLASDYFEHQQTSYR